MYAELCHSTPGVTTSRRSEYNIDIKCCCSPIQITKFHLPFPITSSHTYILQSHANNDAGFLFNSSATCQQTLLECCHSGLSGKSLFLLRILRPSPICTATSRKNVLSKEMDQEHWIVFLQASVEKYRRTALFWVITD